MGDETTGFGRQSTAEEVLRGRDLHKKRILVTGATSGIGEETARSLAAAGASVLVTGRAADGGGEVLDRLRAGAGPGGREVQYDNVDLSSLRSIRAFAERRLAQDGHFDVLIANAGVMATPLGRTAEGFETQFGVNHLGHFALTEALLPLLLRAPDGARVVVLSSRAHRYSDIDFDDPNYEHRPYDPWEAYGQAKTANALHAGGLTARHAADGITAYSVMPGGIATGLQRHMPAEQLHEFGWADAEGNRLTPDGWKTVPQGAATSVWAAVAEELEDAGGRYLEDCAVAETWTGPGEVPRGHVMARAVDPDRAERLWKLSTELVSG